MNHEEYLWYKDHGICVNCKTNKAVRGQTRCPDCREMQRDAGRKRYQKKQPEIRAYYKDWNKSKYEQRKADGVCVRCGKKPPQAGKLSCTRCLIKQSQYKQNSFQRKGGTPRWLAMDLGLCAVCCKRPTFGRYKLCKVCYDHITKKQEATA